MTAKPRKTKRQPASGEPVHTCSHPPDRRAYFREYRRKQRATAGAAKTAAPAEAEKAATRAATPFDPRAVLEKIATDEDAPSTARVAAAKYLDGKNAKPGAAASPDDGLDAITRRALEKRRHLQ